MFYASILEINLHDIHKVGHLSEDQYPMVEDFELGKNPVEELELAGRPENPISKADFIIIFQEHVRMVTAFPLLHHQVV